MQILTFEEAKDRYDVVANTTDTWERQELMHKLEDDIRYTLIHSTNAEDIQAIIQYFCITISS